MNILSKYCGILYRLREVLPSKALFSLYNTLVFPHLIYCNLIWADSNNTNLHSIHLKQKRILRLCSNSHWLEHTPPLFKKYNTLTIYDIHKLTLCSFMYNFKSNNLPDVLLIILFRTDPFTITPLASLTYIVLIISIMILQEIQSEDKALCFGIQLKMSLKMLSHVMNLKENIRLIFVILSVSNYLFCLFYHIYVNCI